jgi:hypothetical protein
VSSSLTFLGLDCSYGNMKTNVLSLTAVMADGRVIKTGSKCVMRVLGLALVMDLLPGCLQGTKVFSWIRPHAPVNWR